MVVCFPHLADGFSLPGNIPLPALFISVIVHSYFHAAQHNLVSKENLMVPLIGRISVFNALIFLKASNLFLVARVSSGNCNAARYQSVTSQE